MFAGRLEDTQKLINEYTEKNYSLMGEKAKRAAIRGIYLRRLPHLHIGCGILVQKKEGSFCCPLKRSIIKRKPRDFLIIFGKADPLAAQFVGEPDAFP